MLYDLDNNDSKNKYLNGHVKTVSFDGVEVFQTLVECQILPGLPSFSIVGLGDKTITESRERVRSALFSFGVEIPNGKIVINLSPANRFKEGSHYDLSIALSILVAIKIIPQVLIDKYIVMGELGLQGHILHTNGVLPAIIFAKKHDLGFIGSHQNEKEMILNIEYKSANNIKELIDDIKNNKNFTPNIEKNDHKNNDELITLTTFNNIYGQEIGKRALIIAAAGRHNLMFIGSKGVGKSMLSRSIIDLLPDLSEDECLETTSIHSIAGQLSNSSLLTRPPMRSPHSSSSLISLIGGGSIPKPGEISLAHNGVLFLDELPEFQTSVIDSLRTPIEEGVVHISRSKYKICYPADFQLIISMNPCKCGNLLKGNCKCKQKNYMFKVSAPIQDRIDIKVILGKVDFSSKPNVNLDEIRLKIKKVRKIQQERFGKYNSRANLLDIQTNGGFSKEIIHYTQEVCARKELSGRSYVKILNIARTIADLDDSPEVKIEHVNESVFFVGNLNDI